MMNCLRILAVLVSCSIGPFTAFAADPVVLPGGGKLEMVDFERHVMGLLSKAGCNGGSCHGSFQGKNGFRLSLRTQSGRFIDAHGQALSGRAILRLRETTDEKRELIDHALVGVYIP